MYYGHPKPSASDFHQWEPVEVPEKCLLSWSRRSRRNALHGFVTRHPPYWVHTPGEVGRRPEGGNASKLPRLKLFRTIYLFSSWSAGPGSYLKLHENLPDTSYYDEFIMEDWYTHINIGANLILKCFQGPQNKCFKKKKKSSWKIKSVSFSLSLWAWYKDWCIRVCRWRLLKKTNDWIRTRLLRHWCGVGGEGGCVLEPSTRKGLLSWSRINLSYYFTLPLRHPSAPDSSQFQVGTGENLPH